MQKRALVTGTAGFIGSRLIKRLREGNFDVIAVDIKDAPDVLKAGSGKAALSRPTRRR